MDLVTLQHAVAGIEARCAELVEGLDPDEMPASAAPELWERVDGVGRRLASVKTLLARRVDDSLVWKREGFANVAEYLAAHGGTSLSAARQDLETSRSLPELPRIRRGLMDGALSGQQGALLADAAKTNPAAEGSLVDAAGRESFKELKDRALRAKAAGDHDSAATQRRIHGRRSLREYTDAEGAWHLHATGTAVDGAKVHAALAPILDDLFQQRRGGPTREPAEARAFDAMVVLAERVEPDSARPARYQGLIRCDLGALQRGRATGDEVCEIAGVGPIPVDRARQLLGEGAVKLVLTRGVDVANVTTLSRKATAAMMAALAWQSPTCRVQGCGRTITEIDHRIPWAETHHTTLGELDPVCGHHHDLKTRVGWALVAGTGPRPFVPPDDPRHPRHRSEARAGPDPPSTAA